MLDTTCGLNANHLHRTFQMAPFLKLLYHSLNTVCKQVACSKYDLFGCLSDLKKTDLVSSTLEA